MLVEGTPFETRHGKPCLGIAALLSCFQFAEGESTHTGVEVNMQLGLRARLTGIQGRKLLGISEKKFDLNSTLYNSGQVNACNRPIASSSADSPEGFLSTRCRALMLKNTWLPTDVAAPLPKRR